MTTIDHGPRPRWIGPTLREFMGESLAEREYALSKQRAKETSLA